MIREFIQTLLADYQRLIVTKFLLGFCAVGGFMFAILILAILLMLTYPAYMWCVFGGFVFLWLLSLVILYFSFRIIRAENRARLAQLDSIESYAKLLTTVLDAFTKKKS
jgi:hypothetical protein